MTPLLHLNNVDLWLTIDPPESKPGAGFTVVARRLSPTIVQYSGTMIGSCASSYVPDYTKITAGAAFVGVIGKLEQAYLIDAHAESSDPPRPDASTPFLVT